MYSCVLCLCLAAGAPGQTPDGFLPAPNPYPAPPAGAFLPAPPAIAHGDFARAFQPAPGKYEVVLIHPDTCCPVRVCFELPCGCPKVYCGKRTVTFDYGRHAVVIRFKLIGGGVRVRYV